MKPTLVILAAGMGSRYGGLKQIDGLGPSNECIFEYAAFDALAAGFKRIVFIIRRDFEKEFKAVIEKTLPKTVEVDYAYQSMEDYCPAGVVRSKPWGTVHAVLCAKTVIGNEPFLVQNADDYYGKNVYKSLFDFLVDEKRKPTQYGMIGYTLCHTLSEFGGVTRGICRYGGDGTLGGLADMYGIKRDQSGTIIASGKSATESVVLKENDLCSMNMWGFDGSTVFGLLENEFALFLKSVEGTQSVSTAELSLPDFIGRVVEKKLCTVKVIPTTELWFGVTFIADREDTIAKFKALEEKGLYPHGLWKNFEMPK